MEDTSGRRGRLKWGRVIKSLTSLTRHDEDANWSYYRGYHAERERRGARYWRADPPIHEATFGENSPTERLRTGISTASQAVAPRHAQARQEADANSSVEVR
jgi:hypothetical protein